MKPKQKKWPKKKLLVLLGSIAIVIVLTICAYTYAAKGDLFGQTHTTSNSQSPTSSEIKAGTQSKQNSENPSTNKDSNSTDTPPAPTPIPNTSKDTVNLSITASNQNGSTYQIRIQIDSPTSTGTCTLSLVKENQTVTKTSGVQALAKVSTCKGFDIPTSELSPGVWQLDLDYSSSTLIGSVSSTITVQ